MCTGKEVESEMPHCWMCERGTRTSKPLRESLASFTCRNAVCTKMAVTRRRGWVGHRCRCRLQVMCVELPSKVQYPLYCLCLSHITFVFLSLSVFFYVFLSNNLLLQIVPHFLNLALKIGVMRNFETKRQDI